MEINLKSKLCFSDNTHTKATQKIANEKRKTGKYDQKVRCRSERINEISAAFDNRNKTKDNILK